MRRRELPDADERGAGGETDQVVNVSTSARGSSSRRAAGWRSSAFASDAKRNVAACSEQEERSDAEAVAREEELARSSRSQTANAKSPFSRREAVGAPLLVRVGDDLGVAVRLEPVAEHLELAAELEVVVDLAVLHHPEACRPSLADRLVAAGEVDDREPGCAAIPKPSVEVEADAVGAAVKELARHREQELPGHVRGGRRRSRRSRTRA